MKTLRNIFGLAIFGGVLFLIASLGCSKQRIQAKPLNDYDSPNKYLDSKKQQEQEYKVDSCTNPPCPCPNVKGNQGTEICIAKTSLSYSNGDSVFFPFYIRLIENYTPKDMIYAQIPTVGGGDILETGGEIRVRAFKAPGGKTPLSLRSGHAYYVKMPNASPKNYMHTYYGGDSAFAGWSDGSVVFADTPSGYYSSPIVKLGWLNCDYNKAASPSYNLTFTSKTDKLNNVAIFVYIPATKTVMQVYNMVSGNIPSGSSVKIICIGVRANGDIYKYYQTLTVSSIQTIDVTMVASSDADLTTTLNGL